MFSPQSIVPTQHGERADDVALCGQWRTGQRTEAVIGQHSQVWIDAQIGRNLGFATLRHAPDQAIAQ